MSIMLKFKSSVPPSPYRQSSHKKLGLQMLHMDSLESTGREVTEAPRWREASREPSALPLVPSGGRSRHAEPHGFS